MLNRFEFQNELGRSMCHGGVKLMIGRRVPVSILVIVVVMMTMLFDNFMRLKGEVKWGPMDSRGEEQSRNERRGLQLSLFPHGPTSPTTVIQVK